MKKIDLMNGSDIEGLWPVASFLEAYKQVNALTACTIASISAESGNSDPDKVAMIICRTLIENGARAQNDQKYIVGIRFYSYGDMATIDVISLDKAYHKDICFEHLTRLGWPSFDEQTGQSVNKFDETVRSPFLFVGGHLKVKNGTHVDFTGASQDYGDNILFSDANAIAAYAASISGIEIGIGDKEKGKAFVQSMLEFMLIQKTKKDFYEQLVQEVSEKTPWKKSFTAQHMGALIAMKVLDRSIAEGKSTIPILIEELSGGGLARHLLLTGVVKNIKESVE